MQKCVINYEHYVSNLFFSDVFVQKGKIIQFGKMTEWNIHFLKQIQGTEGERLVVITS